MRALKMLFGLAMLLLAPSLALASHGGPHTLAGYVVNAITHNQAGPLISHQAEIMATSQAALDSGLLNAADAEKLAALVHASQKEYILALGGKVLGSLTYDWMPWHRPVHAAAAFNNEALLLLRNNGSLPEAAVLANRIDAEMGYMLVPCAYSAMAFATNETVGPDWGKLQPNMTVVQALLAMLVLAFGVANVLFYRKRHQRQLA